MSVWYVAVLLAFITVIVIGLFLLQKKEDFHFNWQNSIFFFLLFFLLCGGTYGLTNLYYQKEFFDANLSFNKQILQMETDLKEINVVILETKEKLEGISQNYQAEKLIEINQDISTIQKELSSFTEEQEILSKQKTTLETKLNGLKKEYQTLYDSTSFIIHGITAYKQYPNYPNGCETVALYSLLKFYKVNVSLDELMEKLDKGDGPYNENGVWYGADPENEFVGDPRDIHGYGVFQKPIIKLANQYKSGIQDITGSSLNTVLNKVKNGTPVQVWVSINLENTSVCARWQERSTQKKIEWLCNLHSVLVVGANIDSIIVADSYTGTIVTYPKTQFEKMYNLFGKRAIYYAS